MNGLLTANIILHMNVILILETMYMVETLMLRKIFFFYFTLFCSLFFSTDGFSMDNLDIKIEEINGKSTIIIRQEPEKEKTAEEILEENKDKPAFMGCTEWLKINHPHFSEEKYDSHPLFSNLKEAMQLADFEVDTLEGFLHKYMETNMPQEQAESFKNLLVNSINAKTLVHQIISFLQGKDTIEKILKVYFTDRLKVIVEHQADLTKRSETLIDMSMIEKVKRLKDTKDYRYTDLQAAFLRSYNTKNKIMRELLYYFRAQDPKPLCERLPEDLLNLLRISPSIHPYLNKQNDIWVDYDQALEMGEARNFMGNAKQLNIDIREFFNRKKISGFKIPKVFKPLSALPLPSFVLEGKQKEPGYNVPIVKKKKNKKETHSF